LPMLILRNQTRRFPAPYLLIQCIQQLLTGCRACECSAVMLRSAEAAEIKQAFRSPVKHNAHPVHQVNNTWSRLTHCLNRRLVCEEVPAVYRIVKMLPRGVAFALRIDRSVNAALRAYGVRP